jgi:type II secretory pathway pseudopilin PulG
MFYRKSNKNLSAFSLIELLVALGIITMVISIGFFAFTNVINNNYQSQELANDIEFFDVAFKEFYQKYQKEESVEPNCNTELNIIKDPDLPPTTENIIKDPVLTDYAKKNNIAIVCKTIESAPSCLSINNCIKFEISMKKNSKAYAAKRHIYAFIKNP